MKKKTKKLVLSKETVRSLTGDLKLVVGASIYHTCVGYGCLARTLGPTCAMYECDAQLTVDPNCVA